ncbi:MAG: oxygen-dependent coproporphyrinogen oxidase [Magnetovibrio sp.]|nr:oxygen-dependent coproporphyrinogen oxidase [Magnetovibrio sp.]
MNLVTPYLKNENKRRASSWFSELRDDICSALEICEADRKAYTPNSSQKNGKFARHAWTRPGGGGGEMSLMKNGKIFEKAGVNVSTVWGAFSDEFKDKVPGAGNDPSFWASGISVVIHPLNPLIPTAHMNTRMIVTTEGWFGGGGDLTPTFPDENETAFFHETYKQACDKFSADYYANFKKSCDEYFFLPHRKEARGVGGIFFDNFNTGNWESDFQFVREIGKAFLTAYPRIVSSKMHIPWSEKQKKEQLIKRGRYVEFNLLYDRGTTFGLKTGGNVDAILMSLPPQVAWP